MKIEVEIEDGIIPVGYEVVRIGKATQGELFVYGGMAKEATHTHTLTSVIVRKKQPSYQERQDAWVKEHGIKVGSKVRVLRTAKDREDGWKDSWLSDMNKAVGEVLVCRAVRIDGYGLSLSGGLNYPYFVLDPVKEPEYVPYTFETMPVEGIKVKHVTAGTVHILEPVSDKEARFRHTDLPVSYSSMLSCFVHLDGTPCGVKVGE